jgi:hypothetical protein
VVVEGPPKEYGEEDVEPYDEREGSEVHEAEDEHEHCQVDPERPPQLQREVVADEEEHERGRERERRERSTPEAWPLEIRGVQQQERPKDEDGVERLALIQDVPEASCDYLEL